MNSIHLRPEIFTRYTSRFMRVGLIGTGAISYKHAQAYKNIGYRSDGLHPRQRSQPEKVRRLRRLRIRQVLRGLCRHPKVDYVDVCTFPETSMQPIEICAETKKHVQVQKPISTSLETARRMIDTAQKAGIVLGVVSQHRFDDSSQFLKKAIPDGRWAKFSG